VMGGATEEECARRSSIILKCRIPKRVDDTDHR